MQKQRIVSWTILIVCAIAIKVFSLFPAAVEEYYSRGAYPFISGVQRLLFGWIPFSMGDIFYAVAFVYLLRNLVLFVKKIFQKRSSGLHLLGSARQLVFFSLMIYVSFNLLWGLNYNRISMGRQMGLIPAAYSTKSLKELLDNLIGKLNAFDSSARSYRAALTRKKTLFQDAVETYGIAAEEYPSLHYRFRSIKPSLYSYAGNYMGFTGYYNPFSGEAQANTTVPSFMQPFTTCHEIGHQLGYAKENEANFAGFLAGRASANAAFRYSVYFDMYAYAIRELYFRDSLQVKVFDARLDENVRMDFKTVQAFYKKYENPVEPLIRKLYDNYLKVNEQPQGMQTYNEVVALLAAYYAKHREL